MPLFEENQNTNQTECGFETQKLTSSSNQSEPNRLMTAIGQLLPLAPLVFEQFTGQKIPAMSGTMAEIQLVLNNLQASLQTVVNNQQQLAQRLIALETNTNQHLINLTNQFNSLRLTHTREKKEIAYNNSSLEDNESY